MPKIVRIIRIPNGKACPIGQYVVAWKRLKRMDPSRDVLGWQWYPVTAREALRDISRGVHDRINRRMSGYGIGRKWSEQWQQDVLQASHQINNPRLIIHWLPADLRGRFAHRLEGGAA